MLDMGEQSSTEIVSGTGHNKIYFKMVMETEASSLWNSAMTRV